MKAPKFANITVFILFFGIALIEAFQKRNWLEAFLFFALGALWLWEDIKKNRLTWNLSSSVIYSSLSAE